MNAEKRRKRAKQKVKAGRVKQNASRRKHPCITYTGEPDLPVTSEDLGQVEEATAKEEKTNARTN